MSVLYGGLVELRRSALPIDSDVAFENATEVGKVFAADSASNLSIIQTSTTTGALHGGGAANPDFGLYEHKDILTYLMRSHTLQYFAFKMADGTLYATSRPVHVIYEELPQFNGENGKPAARLSFTAQNQVELFFRVTGGEMVMRIDTTLGDGLNRMRLPVQGTNMRINWGDGSVGVFTQPDTPSSGNWIEHNYDSPGVYNVSISSSVEWLNFNDEGDAGKLTDGAFKFGDAVLQNVERMFNGCGSFRPTFVDTINTSANIFFKMFEGCTIFNSNISDWDTSSVTNIAWMLKNTDNFNQDISGWDVSNVTVFDRLFNGANSFNQDIGSWDIGSATSMDNMFANASLSVENYSKTLIGWANRAAAEGHDFTGVTLSGNMSYDDTVHNDAYGAGSGPYNDAVSARAALVNTYNLTIANDSDVSTP